MKTTIKSILMSVAVLLGASHFAQAQCVPGESKVGEKLSEHLSQADAEENMFVRVDFRTLVDQATAEAIFFGIEGVSDLEVNADGSNALGIMNRSAILEAIQSDEICQINWADAKPYPRAGGSNG